MKLNPGKYIGVVTVTIAALIVMFTVAAGTGRWEIFFGKAGAQIVAEDEVVRSPVVVENAAAEQIEIIDEYYGRIKPFKRYTIAFETPGRIDHFGTNEQGKPLDVTDHVAKGQVLAQLDTKLLALALRQANVRLEQSQADWDRAEKQRERNIIVAEEFEAKRVALAVSKAEVDIATERLEDATLVSPTDGVIIRRLANVGESVNAHEPIFEVDDVDRVLLVVDVPESRVQYLREGQPAYVRLRARDEQNHEYPLVEGEVYRVGRAADEQSGVFHVEIVMDNPGRWLKAGLVAKADIVVNRIEGFRLPGTAAVTRVDQRLLFAVSEDGKAKSLELDDALEQNGQIILTELPEDFRTVIVRGQHRLVDGTDVEIVSLTDEEPSSERVEVSVSTSAGGPGT